MKEQVLIYEIKRSANTASGQLLTEDGRYFYWNDATFQYLDRGDLVIVVNPHNRKVLFTVLDQADVPAATDGMSTQLSDLDYRFDIAGDWNSFVRLKVLGAYEAPDDWKWKTLGNSERTYLNGDRINTEKAANRILNIRQLKQVSADKHFNEILDTCLENFTDENAAGAPEQLLTIPEIIARAHTYIAGKGFRYQREEIANFYLALRTKPFVILAGISGTGKTQLPRKFAESLGFAKEQVIQLPVRPDWTDSSDLLGYTALDGNFIPKDLTLAIQKATANPKKPYFFILDEMNLARVEHYFSDFLSVIETRERVNGKIQTDFMLREEMLSTAQNYHDFEEIRWPENLYLIGTVNMDETTHAFSRKVLDRANSIEMNEVDLSWPEIPENPPQALSNIRNAFFETPFLTGAELSETDKKNIRYEMDLLQSINKILQKADLQFAYRVRDEIAFYMALNSTYDLMEARTAFDFQLVQKILPRIHGSSERILHLLVELLNLLEGTAFKSEGFEFSTLEKNLDRDNLQYRRASTKIAFMLQRFDEDRFTSFWL